MRALVASATQCARTSRSGTWQRASGDRTRQPLCTGLTPNLHRRIFKRRRQTSWAAVMRAESAGHGLRCVIVRRNRVDHLSPAQREESPLHRCRRSLGCIAPTPAVTNQAPADFGAGPPVRIPWAQPPDPTTRRLLDHREHCEALQMPCAGHHHESAPSKRPRLRSADKVRGFRILQQCGPRTEVFDPRWAQ